MNEKNKTANGEKKIDKRTLNRAKKKPIVMGENVALKDKLKLNDGDNAKYLAISSEIAMLPDIDLRDINQVRQRLQQYTDLHIKYDLKPTVTGLCMVLNNMDKRRFWEIRNDIPCRDTRLRNLPPDVVELLKKAHKIMENMWEFYMLNNKIQPVAGIFMGKNYFGMKDETELTVSPRAIDEYSVEEIKQKYLKDKNTDE